MQNRAQSLKDKLRKLLKLKKAFSVENEMNMQI